MKNAHVLKYYNNLSFLAYSFIYLRYISCPFIQLIEYIPKNDSVLDIGCGYGLLPLLLSMRNTKQSIVGIDPDKERINTARLVSRDFKNITFHSVTIDKLKLGKEFGVVTVIDILYLLPEAQKMEILKHAFSYLKMNGKIFIKINDKSLTLSYFLTWLQEVFTVFIFRETHTKQKQLFFENASDIKKMLVKTGFKVEKIVKLKTPFPFFHPHWLIIGVK